jgi:hypothetical protein
MPASRITPRLNLVLTLETADGEAFVHHMPISREAFEQNYLLIGRTYDAMMREGLMLSGPRLAALRLRDVAREMGNASAAPLLAEIRRLTNLVVPGPSGYEAIPYDAAVREGRVGEDDAAEVDAALTFFTLVSRAGRTAAFDLATSAIGIHFPVQTTSCTCTEYAASLKTSTAPESSGATASTSWLPS